MTVYQHRESWMYDFWHSKIRYRQGGFLTETQAKKAEKEAKRLAKKINRNFSEICRMRLQDLEVRRTARYYRENERLIESLKKLWGVKSVIKREDVENYIHSKKSFTQANKELVTVHRANNILI